MWFGAFKELLHILQNFCQPEIKTKEFLQKFQNSIKFKIIYYIFQGWLKVDLNKY